MTRTPLLQILIAIVVTLGFVALVPIVIRELLYPYRRTRELDEWLDDLKDSCL